MRKSHMDRCPLSFRKLPNSQIFQILHLKKVRRVSIVSRQNVRRLPPLTKPNEKFEMTMLKFCTCLFKNEKMRPEAYLTQSNPFWGIRMPKNTHKWMCVLYLLVDKIKNMEQWRGAKPEECGYSFLILITYKPVQAPKAPSFWGFGVLGIVALTFAKDWVSDFLNLLN